MKQLPIKRSIFTRCFGNNLLSRLVAKTSVRSVKTFSAALALVLIAGCSSISYYSQIVSGHLRIVMGKRPLAEIVSDETVNDSIKHRLNVAQRAREYAIGQLGLPNNQSYTSFYDTGKDYVTWNVVAAEEFSFEPKTWCFPIAGCVSYRGYYAESDADKYAEELKEEGVDTAVIGATAYSTLGWFKDPLLSTMLERSDPGIAALIFHELAHQQLYVGDDSTFNESFASFVEREGLRLWLEKEALSNPQENQEEINAELSARKSRRDDFVALLTSTRDDLEVLYASDIDTESMRQKKSQRFEQMRSEYAELKASWNDYPGYDHWFSSELNNARLVSVATYNEYVPAFEVLFQQSGQSFKEFYTAAQELSDMPADERTAVMEQLLASVSSQ